MADIELRRVVAWDGWAVAAAVAVLLVGAQVLSDWMSVSSSVLLTVGLTLIPWVAFLFLAARNDPVRRGQVLVVVVGNLVWVVSSVVILVGFPDAVSAPGRLIVGIAALMVLGFAVAQITALRQSA